MAVIVTSQDMLPNKGSVITPDRGGDVHRTIVNRATFIEDDAAREAYALGAAEEHFREVNEPLWHTALATKPGYDRATTERKIAQDRHHAARMETRDTTEVVSSTQVVTRTLLDRTFFIFKLMLFSTAMLLTEQMVIAQLVVSSGLFSYTGETLISWLGAGLFTLIPAGLSLIKRSHHTELFDDDRRELYRKKLGRQASWQALLWVFIGCLIFAPALVVSGGSSADPFAAIPVYAELTALHVKGVEAILEALLLILIIALLIVQIIGMSNILAYLWTSEGAAYARAKKTDVRMSEVTAYRDASSENLINEELKTAASVGVIDGALERLQRALNTYLTLTIADIDHVRRAGEWARFNTMTDMTVVSFAPSGLSETYESFVCESVGCVKEYRFRSRQKTALGSKPSFPTRHHDRNMSGGVALFS